MRRSLGVLALSLAPLLALSLACDGGYHPSFGRARGYGTSGSMTSGSMTTSTMTTSTMTTSTTGGAFVAGGGTITSTTTVGGYPVSGVVASPDGTMVYGGAVSPYGDPRVPGYPAYGYGTSIRCTGAVACGASTSVTVERASIGTR